MYLDALTVEGAYNRESVYLDAQSVYLDALMYVSVPDVGFEN